MVQYLHFRILEFPLNEWDMIWVLMSIQWDNIYNDDCK